MKYRIHILGYGDFNGFNPIGGEGWLFQMHSPITLSLCEARHLLKRQNKYCGHSYLKKILIKYI